MDPFILAGVLLLTFIVAFAIGTNDEAMAPAVGAGVFSVGIAVVIGGIVSIFGALIMGKGVSEKVGLGLTKTESLTDLMIIAILISMTLWLILVSLYGGIPISTTQCVVGAIIGVVWIEWGLNEINFDTTTEIFIGWVISPLIGFVGAAVIFITIQKMRSISIVQGYTNYEKQEQIAAYGLAVFLIWTSFSRGGNDVANAVAPLMALGSGENSLDPMVALSVGGIGMAIGLILIGRKVVETLAHEVVSLSPSSALSASLSVSVIMFVGTAAGLPLSGSHILVAALIAVGWAGRTDVEFDAVKKILISWIITVPISAIFAAVLYTGGTYFVDLNLF